MRWLTAEVRERRDETRTAVTLVLDVRGWPGHDAGSHVDVRLTDTARSAATPSPPPPTAAASS